MGRDQPELVPGPAEQIARPTARPLVAEAVEAEPTDPPLLPPGPGEGVGAGLRRHVDVEARVEAGHLGQLGSERLEGPYRRQTGGVVQGGQVDQGLEGLVDGLVQHDGTGERRTTVDDTVPGRID